MKLWIGAPRRLLAFTGGFLAISAFTISASDPAASLPGASAAGDLVSLLRDRSPGHRPGGALTTTKPSKPRAAPAPPAPPVAGLEDSPALALIDIAEPLLPISPAIASPIFPAYALAPDLPAFAHGLGGVFIGPGPGWFGGGGGGGGVGGGGGGSDTPPALPPDGGDISVPPDQPTAPVPESSIWVTMIVGFGAIGAVLRCRCAARRFYPLAR